MKTLPNTDKTATDIKTRAMLQDVAFVLALSKRLAKEIRQGKEFSHLEATRAWSGDATVTIAA